MIGFITYKFETNCISRNNIVPWAYNIIEEMTEKEYQFLRKVRQVQAQSDINREDKISLILLLMQDYKSIATDL